MKCSPFTNTEQGLVLSIVTCVVFNKVLLLYFYYYFFFLTDFKSNARKMFSVECMSNRVNLLRNQTLWWACDHISSKSHRDISGWPIKLSFVCEEQRKDTFYVTQHTTLLRWHLWCLSSIWHVCFWENRWLVFICLQYYFFNVWLLLILIRLM